VTLLSFASAASFLKSGIETRNSGFNQLIGQKDLFDRVQLASVIGVCRECATLSDAGRKLFGATREKRKVQNDADRLRK
jgi:sigma54-dependent transcription regulator